MSRKHSGKGAKDVGRVLTDNRKQFDNLLLDEMLKSAFIQYRVFPKLTIEELFMDTVAPSKRHAKLFKAVQGIVNSTTTVQRKKFSKFLKAVREAECEHVADALENAFNDNGHGNFVTGRFPTEQRCTCKGDNRCSTKRCGCRKSGRHCQRSGCGCGRDCQNQSDKTRDGQGAGGTEQCSSNVESAPQPSTGGTSVQLKVPEVAYDPGIRREMWRSDRPFVLKKFNKKIKKCRGCSHPYTDDKKPAPRFVICHEEQMEFWTGRGHGGSHRLVVQDKVHYHCSSSCIAPRHPYFKPREVTAPPEVARSLTKQDIDSIKCNRIDLSHLYC